MAEREGKFNLAIAAARVTPVFGARPVLPNEIAIWARACGVAGWAKLLIYNARFTARFA